MESVRLTQGVVARQQPPKRVAIATLGCKVNSYESSAIARSFENANWSVVNLTESADVYVVNSCSVTAEADRQSRQQARRLSRANPHAKVIMTGCYAELQPAECADVTGVDLVTGNAGKFDIPRVAAALIQEGEPIPQLPDVPDRAEILPDVLHGYEKRARMNIQVQQGCDQGCTFCVIHTARGKSRSFAASTIEAQVQRAVEAGYREVVICGIDLGAYGNDFDSLNDENHLVKLLEKLSLMEGIFRIRLSSIDPAHLSDPLIELLSRDARFCPYFHLSVQSANTLILKRMKRRYTSELLFERVALARQRIAGLVLGADIMAGFPTETDEQFEQTLAAIKALEISYPHVFPFSPRAGTAAARIPRQVDPAVRRRRVFEAREVGKAVRRNIFREHLGRSGSVLIERPGGKARYNGRLENYLPVRVDVGERFVGQFVPVHICDTAPDYLIAEPIPTRIQLS